MIETIAQKAYKKCIFGVDKLFKIAELYKPSDDVYPLGIIEFDKIMDGGVRDGELIVVSGTTGSGKTLYTQILSTNFHKKGIPSLFFSYEMSPWYLKEKFALMGQDENLLVYAPVELISQKLDFIEKQIIEAKQKACKIVFIDHLHYLIPLQEIKNSSLFIGGIVRQLKQIAIKHEVIMFLIAHTKKIYAGEELDLSSIRDSSMISQEADYVFLVERKKKKKTINTENNISFQVEEQTEWSNRTKISLAKNRRTGIMRYLEFDYEHNTLTPITKKYGEQQSF